MNMSLRVVYKERGGFIVCRSCGIEYFKETIFNFNLDKNNELKEKLREANYSGIVAFKPLCLKCECEIEKEMKVEILGKSFNEVILEVKLK